MTLPRFAAERRRLQHVARSYRPIFPGHRTLDSKPPAAVSAVDRWDRQTDGRTDVQQLHRPCSPYYKTFKTTAKTSAACCVAWRCEQADGWTGIEEELELAGFVEVARVFSVFVLVLGNFVFTQTVVAIILLNIDHATNKFKASPT